MDEEKFKKALRDVKWFSIIIAILLGISLFLTIPSGDLSTPQILVFIFEIALLIGTYLGCKNELMYGPICGVILSILMIISFSIIDIILGIALLIDCINIIKYLKN